MQINKSSNTFPFAKEINYFLYSILCLNFVQAKRVYLCQYGRVYVVYYIQIDLSVVVRIYCVVNLKMIPIRVAELA